MPGGAGGLGLPPSPPMNGQSNQAIAHRAMARHPFGEQHWSPLYKLVMSESGFSNTAQNPSSTAFGMFQFLDGTWAGAGVAKTSDPWLQSVARNALHRLPLRRPHQRPGTSSRPTTGTETAGSSRALSRSAWASAVTEMVLPLNGGGRQLRRGPDATYLGWYAGTSHWAPPTPCRSRTPTTPTRSTAPPTSLARSRCRPTTRMRCCIKLQARARTQALSQAVTGRSR